MVRGGSDFQFGPDELVRVVHAPGAPALAEGGDDGQAAPVLSVVGGCLLKVVAEAASTPKITLQILPFSAGAHVSMDSAFSIIGFEPPTDGEVVYFEHPTCSLYLEKPDEVARYRLVYEHLRAASLPLDESRRPLVRTAEDLA